MEGKYSVDGYYLYKGVRGNQSGEIEIFPDGKIIGKVIDADDTLNMEKLLLGVNFDEDRRIAFIKIAPGLRRGNDVMPVMWDLRTANPEKNLVYTGHFGFLGDDFPILDEIERRLYQGTDLGELKNINSQTLKKVYFNQDILKRLELFARERGWGGEMILNQQV